MTARPRDAASLILTKGSDMGWRALMGRLPASALADADAYVFPGGAVEPGDADLAPVRALAPSVAALAGAPPERACAIANAAIRETYENTGVLIARPAPAPANRPRAQTWRRLVQHGLAPDHQPLTLAGRSISPAGAPERFHMRYFLAPASAFQGALFGGGQLSDVDWYPIAEALRLPTPPATRILLARLEEALRARVADRAGAAAIAPLLISYRNGRAVVRGIEA